MDQKKSQDLQLQSKHQAYHTAGWVTHNTLSESTHRKFEVDGLFSHSIVAETTETYLIYEKNQGTKYENDYRNDKQHVQILQHE